MFARDCFILEILYVNPSKINEARIFDTRGKISLSLSLFLSSLRITRHASIFFSSRAFLRIHTLRCSRGTKLCIIVRHRRAHLLLPERSFAFV